MAEHHTIMARQHVATVLMIEPEMPESVSAGKLVLETAKHNVIRADGASWTTWLSDYNCPFLISRDRLPSL